MRPTPDELASGVRALLGTLRHELRSIEAKSDLRRALYVLREMNWNDAGFALIAENERMAEALNRVRLYEGGEPEPARALRELPRNFVQANAQNSSLRGEICASLERLSNRPLEESAGLRRELVAILTKQP